MLCVPIHSSSVGIVTKPRVTMGEAQCDLMEVTQWKECHENDETASVRRMRCRFMSETSLKQVVSQIVTGIQVTTLNPWR